MLDNVLRCVRIDLVGKIEKTAGCGGSLEPGVTDRVILRNLVKAIEDLLTPSLSAPSHSDTLHAARQAIADGKKAMAAWKVEFDEWLENEDEDAPIPDLGEDLSELNDAQRRPNRIPRSTWQPRIVADDGKRFIRKTQEGE